MKVCCRSPGKVQVALELGVAKPNTCPGNHQDRIVRPQEGCTAPLGAEEGLSHQEKFLGPDELREQTINFKLHQLRPSVADANRMASPGSSWDQPLHKGTNKYPGSPA